MGHLQHYTHTKLADCLNPHLTNYWYNCQKFNHKKNSSPLLRTISHILKHYMLQISIFMSVYEMRYQRDYCTMLMMLCVCGVSEIYVLFSFYIVHQYFVTINIDNVRLTKKMIYTPVAHLNNLFASFQIKNW